MTKIYWAFLFGLLMGAPDYAHAEKYLESVSALRVDTDSSEEEISPEDTKKNLEGLLDVLYQQEASDNSALEISWGKKDDFLRLKYYSPEKSLLQVEVGPYWVRVDIKKNNMGETVSCEFSFLDHNNINYNCSENTTVSKETMMEIASSAYRLYNIFKPSVDLWLEQKEKERQKYLRDPPPGFPNPLQNIPSESDKIKHG